jgi:hypothetical protein
MIITSYHFIPGKWRCMAIVAFGLCNRLKYSIVESAKENGLSSYAYLIYLFEKLPNIDVKDPQAIDLLLHWSEPVQAQFRVNKDTR